MLACALSLGLTVPAAVVAGQNKVDVCHKEGNGSYHLITIAEPAYPSHVSHGDAGVGEPVPGHEGFVFDEDCNPIEAIISCPCDFSSAIYIAIGGNATDSTCNIFPSGGELFDNHTGDVFVVNQSHPPAFCTVENGIQVVEYYEGLTGEEVDACVQDMIATADALGIPCGD